MYRKIMIPVDLGHVERLDKALTTAADLAKHYQASLHLVGVTASTPSAVAGSPEEFAAKLNAFAAAEGAKHGLEMTAHAIVTPDPAVELDDRLGREAEEIGADLIVMASHVPGFAEHIFSSNAGYLSAHSAISVFVVR